MLPKQFQIVNDISRNPQEQLIGVNTDTMNPMTKDSLIKLNDTILSPTQERPVGPYKTNKEMAARQDLNAADQRLTETA